MNPLRIGYVPEHFSTPLLELAKEDGGQTFTLVKCPAGTGEMISRLTANEIDISIALTESLIAGIVNGSKAYKMIGSYVSSPLNWAVITGLDTQFNSIADLRGQKCGVSRIGSGSQVMAQVMADQQGWVDDEGRPEAMDFVVNGSFERLRQSVNDGSTAYFMWEHFTTKPYLSEVRFIGSVPTPWPSWAIAASAPTLASAVSKSQVREILHRLEAKVNEFDSETSRKKKSGDLVEKEFGYPRSVVSYHSIERPGSAAGDGCETDDATTDDRFACIHLEQLRTDVEAWLQTVSYFSKLEGMDKSMILTTLETLTKAGVVTVPEGGWTIEGEILASLD